MSKTVLVTGGAGFIGHRLVQHLLSHTDYHVVVMDRLDYSGSLNRLHDVIDYLPAALQRRVKIVFHDLRAAINPHTRTLLGNPNIILHVAAASHVDRSIENPMDFVQDNVVGTVNLLDYARTLDSLDLFLYFSTDEVFGPAPKGVNFKEYDRYNSSNPYAASKAAGEEFCVAYENTYKMPMMITHTMNVFGERQHPEKFIPKVIRAVRDGQPVTIHADKTLTQSGSRFYIHVEDVASAILFLMNKNPQFHMRDLDIRKFNIVGPQEVTNLEVARMIADVQQKPLYEVMVDFHSSRPGHDLRYALDGSLMAKLGWKPTKTFDEHIADVTQWYLKHPYWL